MIVAPPIRALVAHGSALDRARLVALLRGDPAVTVIGEALSVSQTVAMTKRNAPQVIVIGAHLPAEGGLEAARRVMADVPTPVVIIADDANADEALVSVAALRAGALAVIPKPWIMHPAMPELEAQRFVATIKALSQVKVIHHRPERPPAMMVQAALSEQHARVPARTIRVVAVAASTGGPSALEQLLSALPADFPAPILIVQHMAPGFVQGLAAQLDAICPLTVRVAMHGEPLRPQTVYLAPDAEHLGVSDGSRIVLSREPPVGGFRPSATILFQSVGTVFGASSAHVILTGMGRDGVAGLAVAHALGGRVLAQDEASSVVFGMPGEAVSAGVVSAVLPLTSIAGELAVLARA